MNDTAANDLTLTSLLEQLTTILPNHRILSRDIDRVAYASDASFYRLIPQVVVQPESIAHIQGLFRMSKQFRIPMTFRAAGTSLSGQAVSDGILVDISKTWNSIKVEEEGKSVRVLPGVVGQMVNEVLRPYGAKLGPDPASINSCMVGGIIANNASGMCCGVQQNSYHTIRSLRLVLPCGLLVDTADPEANDLLRAQVPHIVEGLLSFRTRLLADSALVEKIRSKYRLKNTTGYALNAFLDYDSPSKILEHIMIGSEGTLGFIAEAVFDTVPDLPFKSTGLLLFQSIEAAARSIAPLADTGAAALELMDRASLASIESLEGVPSSIQGLPEDACAILTEYHSASEADLVGQLEAAATIFKTLPLLEPASFSQDPKQQARLWKIRKGLFPAVGATKPRGSTVIIEDVAFPVATLAPAIRDLRGLFQKYGFPQAIIFGHAKEGNLHFVITPSFQDSGAIDRYAAFMKELADVVVGRYSGSLKAEHGTGRNIAPFVEQEWGEQAYAIMCELKKLLDPENLLNPGVIINTDPDCFISHIKDLPQVEEEVDRCIECGFCEPKCPSRQVTLTPRQRIVIRRELARRQGADEKKRQELLSDFHYDGIETCATDGLCALACPVGIDTGKLIAQLRDEGSGTLAKRVALFAARNLKILETLLRFGLRAGHVCERILGANGMEAFIRGLERMTKRRLPKWISPMPQAAAALPRASTGGGLSLEISSQEGYVYLPSCLSRTLGPVPSECTTGGTQDSLPQTILKLAERAGVRMILPPDVAGVCCGTPFSSKGYSGAYVEALRNSIEACYRWSNEGRFPIVLDTSPCAFKLKSCAKDVPEDLKLRYGKLKFLDGIEFAHDVLLPRLTLHRQPRSVGLHPVCSAQKMGLQDKLKAVCEACVDSVFIPPSAGCCGFAGDRGFLVPELATSAVRAEGRELDMTNPDCCVSSSRTCELGLSRNTGRSWDSFFSILDAASAPVNR